MIPKINPFYHNEISITDIVAYQLFKAAGSSIVKWLFNLIYYCNIKKYKL